MEDFTELVKTHQKHVYNICLRFCCNPEDAFDLSQEIFLKAWRGLDGFRGDSSVFTWLYRLTYNVCADFARKKSRRRETVSLDDKDLPLNDERYEPALALERKELSRSLEKALELISPEHKHILVLRETAGLSYREIADILSLEEGTVKSRIARARLALRELLIKDGNYLPEQTSNKQKPTKGGGGRHV